MKGQKQSRVDNIEKRIAAMTNVLQQIIREVENTKTMVFGQQEVLKQLPDYEKIIEKLKEKAAAEHGKRASFDTDGKTS
tara:strand:- start:2 stop:238 length:237 start_codon:yes stop_codon:yes gene_type:complete